MNNRCFDEFKVADADVDPAKHGVQLFWNRVKLFRDASLTDDLHSDIIPGHPLHNVLCIITQISLNISRH